MGLFRFVWRSAWPAVLAWVPLAGCGSSDDEPGGAMESLDPSVVWTARVTPRGRGFMAHSSPVLSEDGTIYTAGIIGGPSSDFQTCLFALNPDGSEKGRLPGTKPPTTLWVAVYGTTAYAVDSAGGLYVLPSGPGASFQPGPARAAGERESKPVGPLVASGDGSIYARATDGLYSLSMGQPNPVRWRYGSRLGLTPHAGPDGIVYATGDAVYALDSYGTLLWRSDPVRASYGGIGFGFDGMLVVPTSREVLGLSRQGALVWGFPLTEEVRGAPRVGRGWTVYVATVHRLYALTSGGEQKWTFESEVELSGSPALTDDTVIVGDTTGNLFGLSLDGQRKWTVKVSQRPATPTLGWDKTLYVLCQDGVLYAVRPPS